eukprot:6185320-Pleurochrysis_carterae.AAC.4
MHASVKTARTAESTRARLNSPATGAFARAPFQLASFPKQECSCATLQQLLPRGRHLVAMNNMNYLTTSNSSRRCYFRHVISHYPNWKVVKMHVSASRSIRGLIRLRFDSLGLAADYIHLSEDAGVS